MITANQKGDILIMDNIHIRIKEKKAKIAVIGLGYVGLPLAVEFAKAGFKVSGIDLNKDKVSIINDGKNYIQDVNEKELSEVVKTGYLSAHDDFSILSNIDAVSICVPTPLRKTKDPDISYIVEVTKEIKKYLHKGQLIVLESTTYPGTTDEVILSELQATDLNVGEDFFLAFSPERIDPGNKTYKTENTPKIIGGVTQKCTSTARLLYEHIIDTIVPVSSTKSAEMVKLLENTFRAVNIGMVNEIALMCDRLDINVWEVIEAAATKPFGFMPFYPGPGLGGHCIPVDPHYLAWKLKTVNYKARFIDLAEEINATMPSYVVSKISDALNNHQKSVKNSSILILGIAYKKDINDIRESPALDIIKFLVQKEAKVFYNDPYVHYLEGYDDVKKIELEDGILQQMDCILIATDHSNYDFEWIVKNSTLVVDTRNAAKEVKTGREKIVRL